MLPVITITKTGKGKQQESEKPPLEAGAGAAPARAADARRYVNGLSATIAAIVWVIGIVAAIVLDEGMRRSDLVPWTLLAAALAGAFLLFAIKVVEQWEKAVVLRFGKFRGLRGPGVFWIVPVVDVISHLVDQRVRATDVTAESALTRDTVPVNVDAIVFWLVWDAQKAVLEVQSYFSAIFLSSQTALREAIGRHDLAEMITEREKLGQELAKILDEKTNPWGITVQSVEIRDVRIPAGLEDAMSRRAQAERERQARIILGTAETEIAALFSKASELYRANPTAMHLRAMNMLYEAIKEKGSMVIVPSSAVETMGLGGMLGTTALGATPPGGSAP
ncbi:MAG TPA: slipin family protein [Thermoanaerobaculaceae bacterium]|nr:slipin family protein [Thermoanaerobaculaceae bacterium]